MISTPRAASHATLDELSAGLAAGRDAARAVVVGLPDAVVWDGDEVWRERFLREKEAALAGAIAARGHVHRADLGDAVGVRGDALHRLLRLAATRGAFTGWVQWDEGVVYARGAEAGLAASRCPRCAGALRVEGRGVVQCAHCDAEIFV